MGLDFNTLGSPSILPTTSTTATDDKSSSTQSSIGMPTKDDIEKAAEQAGLLGIFIMFPQLETPATPGSPSTGTMALAATEQQCMSNLLNQWSENLQQISQLDKEKSSSDQVTQLQQQNNRLAQFVLVAQFVNPQLFSGVNVTVGADGNLQLVQTNPTLVAAPSNTNGVQPTDNQSTASAGQAAALGLSMVTFVALGAVGFSDAAFQSTDQVLGSVLQTSGVQTIADTTGAQALLASLFGTSVIYPSLGAFAKGALADPNADPNQFDIQAALQFIQNTAAFIQDPSFSSKVLSTVPDSASLSTDTQDKLVALAKLSYILTALSLAYKVETGGGTGAEIWQMANGQTALSPNDPREGLITLFQQQLSVLDLTPDQLAQIQTSFSSTINSSTSFSKLTDTIGLLKDIQNNGQDLANTISVQTKN